MFFRSDDTMFVSAPGGAALSGGSFSAQFDGYADFGNEFTDTSTHGTGSVTGTVQTQTSITATDTFATDMSPGVQTNGALALTFDNLYNNASSLSLIDGTYSGSTPTAMVNVTVDSAGNVTGTLTSAADSSVTCPLSGQVTVIDPTHNAYRLALNTGTCTGSFAGASNAQLSGMVYLDSSTPPTQLIGGAASSTAKLAVAFDLTKQ